MFRAAAHVRFDKDSIWRSCGIDAMCVTDVEEPFGKRMAVSICMDMHVFFQMNDLDVQPKAWALESGLYDVLLPAFNDDQ